MNSAEVQLDEEQREYALSDLRRQNFNRVLDALAEAGLPPSSRVLDVGCGHGWFLMAAAARGYRAVGIEPDAAVEAIAEANDVDVRLGYFPDVLDPTEKFDAVVFNDVFEHLPDPVQALKHVRACVMPTGLVAINLPLATGAFYVVAEALDCVGVHSPYKRMWQVGFPSPHRSYFTSDQLARLAARHGFRESVRRSLPSLRVKGLWQRLRYDTSQSFFLPALMWPVLAALSTFLRFLPPDIGLHIFAIASPDEESGC